MNAFGLGVESMLCDGECLDHDELPESLGSFNCSISAVRRRSSASICDRDLGFCEVPERLCVDESIGVLSLAVGLPLPRSCGLADEVAGFCSCPWCSSNVGESKFSARISDSIVFGSVGLLIKTFGGVVSCCESRLILRGKSGGSSWKWFSPVW